MFDLLEKLRSKPEKTRRKIVAALTAVIALVIFSFWLVATIWKIEHPQASDTATSSISSDISNFVQKAQNAAPAVSF
jgi:hypothetical protein